MNIFKTELPKKDGLTDFSNCQSELTGLNLKDLSSEYHFEELGFYLFFANARPK